MNVSKLIILAMALSLPVGIAYADAPDGTISPDEITMDIVPTGVPASIIRDKEESRTAFASRQGGTVTPDQPEVEVETPVEVDLPADDPVDEPKKVCKRK